MSDRIKVDLSRPVKRRLDRTAKKTRDAALRTRIRIVLLYARGWGAQTIASALGCVPATAVRVVRRFLEQGEAGLEDGRWENGYPKVDVDLLQALAELVRTSPESHGWPRSTWTRELLSKALEAKTGVWVSVTTVARMLRELRARWGMARPTVRCPWPRDRKDKHLAKIRRVLERLPRDEVAFFEDEVDIHLNPRIGRDWMLPRRQKMILTPGRNQKRYVAGALSIDGRSLVFVSGFRKNTDLFLALLEKLRRLHPRARRIHLVLDNYSVHSARRVESYLRQHAGRLVLHFLPPYSPEANDIERLWRELHANVTRNHRCRSIDELMGKVTWYLAREAHRRRRGRLRPGTIIKQFALAA